MVHPLLETYRIFKASEEFPQAREAIVRKLSDGTLICTYTTGGVTEPLDGNFTAFSLSYDSGVTWTDAQVFLRHPSRGLFTTELFCTENAMHAYFTTYSTANQLYENTQTYVMSTYDGGKSFTMPKSLPGGINSLDIRQGIILESGRWVIPVCWWEFCGYEWAAPSVGNPIQDGAIFGKPIRQTIFGPSVEQKKAYRAVYDWARNNHSSYSGVLISDDNGESYRLCGRLGDGNAKWFWEPAVTELSDGSLKMLIRAQDMGCLWESTSFDKGETWTPAKPGNIVGASTKVRLLKDSKGRIYLLHNPDPEGKRRNPLELWISNDDMKSWYVKERLVIRNDNKNINYPDGYIEEETNTLCFAWEDAENVYFSRLDLNKLL